MWPTTPSARLISPTWSPLFIGPCRAFPLHLRPNPRSGSPGSRALVFGFAGSAVQALMPLVARDLVRGGPVTFGLLLGAFGVGAIAGGLLSSRIRQVLATETLVRLAFIGFAACTLVTAYSSRPYVTIPAM